MLKYCDKDGIEKTIIDNENINDYVSGSGKGFSDFFHNNDLKIINDNGDIEIGESSDVNTHVTRITNDCNMAFELTVNGDMGVGGNIDIEGDMSVGGNINQIGPLANLTTDAKSNLVSAINETAAEKNKYWGGTQAKWEQFETDHPEAAEKVEVRFITDDSETGSVVDVVKDGDMRAVTSNAVAEAIAAVNMDSAMSIDTTKWLPSGQVHAFKVGQLGIINWGGYALIDISTDVNNSTKVAQLPVGFRPGNATESTLMTINGTVAALIINAAGEVSLCCPSNTLKAYYWAWGQLVFVIGN